MQKINTIKLLLLGFSTITSLSISLPVLSDNRGLERVNSEQVFREGKKFAIIIGINSYVPNTGLSKLNYAVSDATMISSTLDKQGFTTKVLLDGRANKTNIINTIKNAGRNIKRNGGEGTLVLVYSGHGFSHGKTNYLATFGTNSNNPAATGLSLDTIEATIKNTKVKRAMMFIDACRDQALLATSKSTTNKSRNSFVPTKTKSEGIKILYATKFGDVSWETSKLPEISEDKKGHGLFSYFLNEAFKGVDNASHSDGIITFSSLKNYVEANVPIWAKKIGKTQKPFSSGESRGTFVIGTAIDKRIIRQNFNPTLPEKPHRPTIQPVKEKPPKRPVTVQPIKSKPPYTPPKTENEKIFDEIRDFLK